MVRSNVEVDLDGNPRVSKFQDFASKNLIHVCAGFFYIFPLALGLHQYDFFRLSPLVNFSSKIIGFCASFLAWFPAYFIMAIVFGKFTFAKEVFRIYAHRDFSIAIAFVFLLMPIAIFLTRIINRTLASNIVRRSIFYVALSMAIISLISFINYIEPLRNSWVYLFSCAFIGLIYFTVFILITGKKIKNTRRQQF